MASLISWAYRIALVGKPSAGKSSLFNALTRAGLARNKFEKTVGGGTVVAKVSAAPFTTIQPNIGEARYAAPASSEPPSLVWRRSPTAHGMRPDRR